METTIKVAVNGIEATLVYGGEEWPVVIGGQTGGWDDGVLGVDYETAGIPRETFFLIEEALRRGVRQVMATRPSQRPAVLEVC